MEARESRKKAETDGNGLLGSGLPSRKVPSRHIVAANNLPLSLSNIQLEMGIGLMRHGVSGSREITR